VQDDRGGNPVLKWLAVVVPGLAAGLGWTATAGSPPLLRFVWSIAVGLVIYALLHFFLKGVGNRD
jgi:hypothetical protein